MVLRLKNSVMYIYIWMGEIMKSPKEVKSGVPERVSKIKPKSTVAAISST